MALFGCANDEQFLDEKEDNSNNESSPCKNCKFNNLNQCFGYGFECSFINDSFNHYGKVNGVFI